MRIDQITAQILPVGLILLCVAARGSNVLLERTFWCLVGAFIALFVVYVNSNEQQKDCGHCQGVTPKRESQSNSSPDTSASIGSPPNEAQQMLVRRAAPPQIIQENFLDCNIVSTV